MADPHGLDFSLHWPCSAESGLSRQPDGLPWVGATSHGSKMNTATPPPFSLSSYRGCRWFTKKRYRLIMRARLGHAQSRPGVLHPIMVRGTSFAPPPPRCPFLTANHLFLGPFSNKLYYQGKMKENKKSTMTRKKRKKDAEYFRKRSPRGRVRPPKKIKKKKTSRRRSPTRVRVAQYCIL